METSRRGFLKQLGMLAAIACIPKSVEAAVNVIEKKTAPLPEKRFINHMTIQRKTVTVTGSAQSNIVWYVEGLEDYKHYQLVGVE